MELQAITGRLHIREGEAKPDSAVPGILAVPAPKRADKNRRRDLLFVHLALEPLPESTVDALAQDLVEAFGTAFYQTAGTINTALRQAVRELNQLLLNWNTSNSGQRREGAITCAVMRQDELYVIQVGPSLALLGHNFGVERIPAHDPLRVTPLGQTANIDFRFAHFRLQPGDMLLFAEPHMVNIPTAVLQPALVDTEVEIGLEELKDIVGERNARLLLVEFNDAPPPEFPDSDLAITAIKPSTGRSSLPRAVRPRREGDVNFPDLEGGARRGAAAAARKASQFTDGVADVLEQVLPIPAEETQEPSRTPQEWALPTAVSVLIPILVAIIITSVFLQRENTQRVSDITQQMSQALGLAADETEEINQRGYYLQVLQLGQEAYEIRPQDGRVENLMSQARAELDRLDNITRLIGQPIYSFADAPESKLTAVSANPSPGSSSDVFTLDQGTNRVHRHIIENTLPLNESGSQPQTILFAGQAVQNHIVGTITDIMWRASGTSVTADGLAMLDSRGALLTFYPEFENTRAAQLGLSSGWREPSQIKGFSERLYVLDATAGYIWRYYPAGDELEIQENDQAITFFDDAELARAIDFDISASDGTVIVLYRDGSLNRFADGRAIWPANTLPDGGLTTPMLAPSAVKIVGRGSTSSIFVLDPGSGRLLQFALGGKLLAQFRVTDEVGLELLQRATDFAVLEDPLRIFITAEQTLYGATLP